MLEEVGLGEHAATHGAQQAELRAQVLEQVALAALDDGLARAPGVRRLSL